MYGRSRASSPGSIEPGHTQAFARRSRWPCSRSAHRRRVLRLAQGCWIRHRRRRPACYLGAIRMLVGFVLGGPPGRGMARPPAASCGLTGRAMDDRSAGVLAGGAPSSDNLTDQCAIDRCATARMARRCAVLETDTPDIRARAEPCPMGREPGKDARLPIAPSRTRGRRQDAADVAQSPAARRAAKNKPGHYPDLHRGSRQDAGVELAYPASLCEPQDAASTRKLELGHRSHPREGTRTSGLKGAGHGCPAPTSVSTAQPRSLSTPHTPSRDQSVSPAHPRSAPRVSRRARGPSR